MKIKIQTLCVAVLGLMALSGCSSKHWKAEGNVAGGEGKDLVVEAPNGRGGWYAVDTVTIGKKGDFKVTGEAVGHPEVFRLNLGSESLYFPIDSLETISIQADASHFATGYTLSGSETAEAMQKVNDLIAKAVAANGEQAAFDPDLKRQLAEAILRDPSGIVAYYVIFRKIGQTPLFDPQSRADLRLIGAVATAFDANRPNDPRTAFLASHFITHHRKAGGFVPTDTLVAQEVKLPEIALLDKAGKIRSLNEEASKGKVIVLNFTAYGAQESPAFNRELAKVYNANHAAGMEIYQVSVDEDEFLWKQAAKNLPWIAVYNSPKDGAEVLLRYNISQIPTTFIINRRGELVERVDDVSHLAAAVGRYM